MGPSSKPPPLRRVAELLGLRLEIKRIVESDETYTCESADDKVQRVYTNAVRKLPDYTPHPDGMKPWLVTITRNVMGESHRETKRHQEVFEPDDGHVDTAETPEVSPERAAELKQAMEKLTAALRDMPPSQAAVLWMVCVEERSHEEAGATLGISEDAAKMALLRAREDLRARFGNTLFTGPHPVLALLSDCIHLLGHLWAFLMAMLFASFALSPRERAPEMHAVATGVARVVAASAAGRLGLVLVEGGRPEDAAELLLFALHQAPATTPIERAERKRFFEAHEVARAHGTWVEVIVSHAGARVTVDGIDRNPARRSAFWTFVAGGEHEIRASLDGFEEAVVKFTAIKGENMKVPVPLTARTVEKEPAVYVPEKDPTAT